LPGTSNLRVGEILFPLRGDEHINSAPRRFWPAEHARDLTAYL